jgi:hypothetical protein
MKGEWRKEPNSRGPPGLSINNKMAIREMSERKLELVFIDKEGNFYPIGEVNSAELAKGLKNISEEIATRLRLQKEQR